MTLDEIDKQFELAKIRCSGVIDLDSTPPIHHTAIKVSTALAELDRLKYLVHQIYTQAKAEQREEDARVAEGNKKLYPYQNSKTELADMYDSACDDIAKAIRGAK